MAEYIDKHKAYLLLKDLEAAYIYPPVKEAYGTAARRIDQIKPADVQPVPQWISVKERLPEIGKSVLIYYPYWDGDEIQVAKLEYDEMMFDVCGEFNIRVGAVTHWMPLPKPPKDGEINDLNDK